MKVLVSVKRVVDYNVKVRPLEDGSDVDLRSVKMSANPFCEIAVEGYFSFNRTSVRAFGRGQSISQNC